MKIDKISHFFDQAFHFLSFLAFMSVGILVLIQIFGRYTPWFSTPWTDELTRMFFLYSIMLGAPMAIRFDEYAIIDVVTSNLYGKKHDVLVIFNSIIVTIITFVGMQQALKFFLSGLRTATTSLQINMGYFYVTPLMIFILTFLYSVIKSIELIQKVLKGAH